MADVKISGLPASTTPLDGTEVLPIVQGSTTKQVSVTNLTSGRSLPALNFSPTGSTIPSNGMFLPATNVLGFATNSTERYRIFSSGGIAFNGTVDPGANNIVANGAATNYLGAINPTAAPSASFSASSRLYMSGSSWNSGVGSVAMSGYLQINPITYNVAAPLSKLSVYVGSNAATPSEIAYFSNDGSYSNKQTSAASSATSQILGNANAQGTATWRTVVRQVPVVSLGTQLIIPMISQSGQNYTTMIRLSGAPAKYNQQAAGDCFTANIGVGHLTSIAVASWGLGGNISSISTSGMNIIVNFTNNYTRATADGVFICLEYLCANSGTSIDVANIVMN